jgi:hypothetical protein
MGAIDGPLRRIDLVMKILTLALKAELVDLEMELYQTCTPLIHYAGGSGQS